MFSLLSQNCKAVEIIVNNSNETKQINKRELRAIFGIKLSKWNNSGKNITVVVFSKKNRIHNDFCKSILRVFPHQLSAAWDRITYTGSGQAPIMVESAEEMIKTVSTIPGAIGYFRDVTENDPLFKIVKESDGRKNIVLKTKKDGESVKIVNIGD
ncbi:MAG: hypothetical protein D6B27_00080 [Gammaproteobacteria bacterium]|nr:MAG: hypothetical protein D6B27_00080 [Gammaproteobacteria bacterium]